MSDDVAYTVEVEFQEFGWTALNEAAQIQGVTLEELVQHAAMYYLARGESDPISRNVPAAQPDSSGVRL